jgi:hypothetical protein
MNDHDSNSSFENLYYNLVLDWEQCGRDEQYWDLGFKVELLELFDTLQTVGFIDWLHEVKQIKGQKFSINWFEENFLQPTYKIDKYMRLREDGWALFTPL